MSRTSMSCFQLKYLSFNLFEPAEKIYIIIYNRDLCIFQPFLELWELFVIVVFLEQIVFISIYLKY